MTGTDIAIEDLEEIMQEIDVDGEEGLDFNEFQIIMRGVDLEVRSLFIDHRSSIRVLFFITLFITLLSPPIPRLFSLLPRQQNMAASDLALSFSERARAASKTFQANDPLWMSMGGDGKKATAGLNARMQLAM